MGRGWGRLLAKWLLNAGQYYLGLRRVTLQRRPLGAGTSTICRLVPPNRDEISESRINRQDKATRQICLTSMVRFR